jgi:hypothetical protein
MNFTKLLILSLLSSFLFACTQLKTEQKNNIVLQGAYFGQEGKEEIVLVNLRGNIEYRSTLDDSGIFEFKLSEGEVKEGPFYLIYTYNRIPSLNPEPPYIKAKINFNQNTYLPAILVFKPNFQLEEKDKNTISFKWDEAIFSKSNNSYFRVIAEYKNFWGDKQHIITAQIPYRKKMANIELKDKLRNKSMSLKKLFRQKCKTKWFLQLPYKYPEGLQINYASEAIDVNFCE